MADFERLQAAVEAGDRDVAVEITQQAIDEGIPPLDILDPMTDAMGVVGDRFSRQELFVPEMLISARAMKGAVALLEPLLIGAGHRPDKIAVMGTSTVSRITAVVAAAAKWGRPPRRSKIQLCRGRKMTVRTLASSRSTGAASRDGGRAPPPMRHRVPTA